MSDRQYYVPESPLAWTSAEAQVRRARHRSRIGDMGYPRQVWMVYTAEPGSPLHAYAFYDRERALAWAAASEHRHIKKNPIPVKDAMP